MKDQINMVTLFATVIALEIISLFYFYFIQIFNLVILPCFSVNLLQSFVSRPKALPTMNGKTTQHTKSGIMLRVLMLQQMMGGWEG